MNKYILNSLGLLFFSNVMFSQNTATDFTIDDCNNITHNLYDELDSGNVIVICWVMPCPPCATYAEYASDAVQSFEISHPDRVKYYLADDYGDHTCDDINNWASPYNIDIDASFSNTDLDMLDYGQIGMPKVVVIGKSTHTVYYNGNNNQISLNDIKAAIDNALSPVLEVEKSRINKTKISVFPNPVNNMLNILYTQDQSTSIYINVVDILGKTVLSVQKDVLFSEEELINSINISELDNGNYFLRIYSENIIENIPFVVSH